MVLKVTFRNFFTKKLLNLTPLLTATTRPLAHTNLYMPALIEKLLLLSCELNKIISTALSCGLSKSSRWRKRTKCC